MRFSASLFGFFLFIFPLTAQNLNFNTYYRYPVAVGVGYQSLTPVREFQKEFNIIEAFIDCHVPMPFAPVLHANAQFGMISFDARDEEFPVKWDHSHWYGAVGASYVNRFIKELEIGADLELGFSQAVFLNLVEEPVGAFNFFSRAGARISLVPSYNFSLDIRPNITLLKTFSTYTEYDGVLLGLTFSANYRFGDDPDSMAALIRSLKFEDVKIPPVFGALQSFYGKNPLGSVTLSNTEKYTLQEVEIYFYQAGFMDSPTLVKVLPELKPAATLRLDLYATFNQEIFTTEGITPLTGEIVANYKIGRRAVEQRYPVNYDLYDKTALIWDDDQKTD